MKIKTIISMLIMLLSLSSFSAFAVPPAISYQGYLTDPSGSPVDGNVDIIFSLYDTENTNINSWQETQTSVAVSKGLFNVQLGSVTSFVAGQFDVPMWLGIQVGADAEMSPRQPLNSVGYALKAEDAETLAGHIASQLDQSAHVTDTANPHNVTAAQTGAASVIALGSHTSNSANPHNVTAAQAGAASASVFSTHSTDTAAHHARYQDSEAVSAMAAKTDSNPLHHDKYLDSQAVAAIKADVGTGLNADTVDNLHANEIIDAASDEVRIPIPNGGHTFIISTPGSYYLTGNKHVYDRHGIMVDADHVNIDLMGFRLSGSSVMSAHTDNNGVYIMNNHNYVTVRNGSISTFLNGILAENLNKTNFKFINLYVTGSAAKGIYIKWGGSFIKNCEVSNNALSGLWSRGDNIILNSKFLSNGEDGVIGGSNNIIKGNIFSNNSRDGLVVNSNSHVINNNFQDNGKHGISAQFSNIIKDNVVFRNGGVGIFSSRYSIVKGNTIRDSELSGIYSLFGNFIDSNNLFGNNKSDTFGEAGIKITATQNTIINNSMVGNYRTSLRIANSKNVIENNRIFDGSIIGISFEADNNYYSDNRVGGHPILNYNLNGHAQIDGGGNIQF